jgi:hypothetical protein
LRASYVKNGTLKLLCFNSTSNKVYLANDTVYYNPNMSDAVYLDDVLIIKDDYLKSITFYDRSLNTLLSTTVMYNSSDLNFTVLASSSSSNVYDILICS